MENRFLIAAIKKGDNKVLSSIYKEYRQEFISWCIRKYEVDNTLAAEVYQDSIIILYRNICNSKLTELNSSIKTYLFGIGKNKLREKFRSKTVSMSDSYSHNLVDDSEDIDFAKLEDAKIEMVMKCMHRLLDSCRTLLRSYYFLKMSMNDMAAELGYKNADTVKNLKYKCIQRLREMVNQEMNDLKTTP